MNGLSTSEPNERRARELNLSFLMTNCSWYLSHVCFRYLSLVALTQLEEGNWGTISLVRAKE